MGVYCYADNLSLLSPSLTGLQEMLRLCELYAINHNIIFNDKKMLIVRIVQVNFTYLGEKLFGDSGNNRIGLNTLFTLLIIVCLLILHWKNVV